MQWLNCQSHDEKLNDKTLTTFNILNHYGINDIIFSNFPNTMVGSTYVKGAQNKKKIESLSKKACGVLNRIINGSTNLQQVCDIPQTHKTIIVIFYVELDMKTLL